MEVAVPRCLNLLRPDSLEVRGQRAIGTRTADEQVAPEVEEQGIERGVLGPSLRNLKALNGRFLRGLALRKVQLHASIELPVVGRVCTPKLPEGFAGSLLNRFMRVFCELRVEHACAGREEQHDLVSALHFDTGVGRRDLSAARHGPNPTLKSHTLYRRVSAGQLTAHDEVVPVSMDLGSLFAR